MFVAEACSGMRQLTGFLALTAAVAYLSARPWWYRGAILASAVPIAITANVARVILTGYIMYFVDPTYASGTFHTVEGLLMMAFGLSLLRGEYWVLDQVAALLRPAGAASAAVDAAPRLRSQTPAGPGTEAGPLARPIQLPT
jgi:exosortase/archaeosortase family protein